MNIRMMRPGGGRPTRRSTPIQDSPDQASRSAVPPSDIRPAAPEDRAATRRADRRPTGAPIVDSRQPDPLSGFFDDDQLSQPAMPMPDLPAGPASMAPPMQTGYAPIGSTAPVDRRQTPVDGDRQRASTGARTRRPIAGGGSDAQTASATPAAAGQDRRPARSRLQSDSMSRGRQPAPPAAAPPTPLDEDPQYREFLAWKQAQAHAQADAHLEPTSTSAGTQAAGVDVTHAASGHGKTAATGPDTDGHGGRRRSAAHSVRSDSSSNSSPETASSTASQIQSADGAFTPFHYPGYDGPGYPKGLGHGPIVTRRNIKTGKLVSIEGIAWEEFPESWRQMLDEKPYDDAGALRVFLKATSGVASNYPYYEVGSAAHASKFLSEMRSKRALIRNGVDLSYSSRPRLDASLWR